MSGFDAQLRTDQHNSQNRRFYDQQRYQSDRNTADIIGSIPGRMQQAQMNQQAMEQQQLQSVLMEKQVESDLRMQEAAIEEQFHRNKIDKLLQLDAVAMSFEEKRAMKLSNDSRELDYKKAKEDWGNRGDNAKTRVAQMMMGMGGDAMTFYGFKPVLDGDGNVSLEKLSDDEREFWTSGRKGQSGSETRHNLAERRQWMSSRISAIKARLENPSNKGDYQAAAQELRGLEAQHKDLFNEAMETLGGKQRPQGSVDTATQPTPTPPPPPPQPSSSATPMPQAQRTSLIGRMKRASMNRIMNGGTASSTMPVEDVVDSLWANRKEVRDQWRQYNSGDRSRGALTDAYIDEQIERVLTQPGLEQWRDELTAWLELKQKGVK